MKGNFTRINNILSNDESVQIPRIFFENGPKFFSHFRFLKKHSVNGFLFACLYYYTPILLKTQCRLPLVNVDYLPQVSTTPNKLTTPPCVDYPQMW